MIPSTPGVRTKSAYDFIPEMDEADALVVENGIRNIQQKTEQY